MSKFFENYLVLILVLLICLSVFVGVVSDGFKNWGKFQSGNSSALITSEKEDSSLICSEVSYTSVFNG